MKTMVCSKPGCSRTAEAGSRFCQRHRALRTESAKGGFSSLRGKSALWHPLYDSAAWRKRRREFLAKNPVCAACGRKAEVADHIVPHRGDAALFGDDKNLQPLCRSCHSKKTLAENGFYRGKKAPRG